MAKQSFAALQAAAIDGRTRNIYYRRTQLEKLHKTLSKDSTAIISAIATDSGYTHAEAQVEYSLALLQLRERYAELDPVQELKNEYAIAEGKNASETRIGYGMIIIDANGSHSPFFSVIAPLSAAIAAGNCVILQMENSLRALPKLLKGLLQGALDSETFDITQQEVTDAAILDNCILVNQDLASTKTLAHNQLVSNTSIPLIAVVDRTADLEEAAKALTNARFSYGGRSPYAPDLVLVNEFVRKGLLQALVRQSVAFGESAILENGTVEKQKGRDRGLKELTADLQRNGDVRVVSQESDKAIVDIRQRSHQLLDRKVKEPCMIVHGFKSLDDAIDLINNNGQEVLAAYHWGAPAQCKYLSQFVSARVTFVNQIPAELLIGPAFPAHHPINPSVRYPAELFSKPAPAFIQPSLRSLAINKALFGTSASENAAALQALKQEAISDLPDSRARPQKIRAAFGFFEQAMVMNLGLVLLSTVTVVSGGVYWMKHGRLFR